MRTSYFIIGLALLSALPATAQQNPVGPTGSQTPLGQVVQDPITEPIRKNDILRVTVVGEPLYTGAGEFKVSDDGTIELPRVGQVRVEGNSTIKAASFIEQRLKSGKYLKNPNVVVQIYARKAREVSLNGAIGLQGRRVLRDGTRLSDMLEDAVPAQLADLENIEILRGKATLKINYKKFRNGQDSSESSNPFLEDGDRIFVRLGEPTEGTVKIIGEVKDITKSTIQITSGTMLSQVISIAGGLSELGDRKNVYLMRGGLRIVVPYEEIAAGVADKDIKLQDKDEIYIPRLEKPRQYIVNGGVERKGAFPLVGKITVLQAVATAGPLEGAKRKEVELVRASPDGKYPDKARKINLEKPSEAALELQDGDVIRIPEPSRGNKFDLNQVLSAVGSMIWISSLIRR
jgi:protein involved in polysaccharide export with SLBB domain